MHKKLFMGHENDINVYTTGQFHGIKNPVKKVHSQIRCLCDRGMKLPPRLPSVTDEIAGPEKVRGVYRTQNRRCLLLLHHFLHSNSQNRCLDITITSSSVTALCPSRYAWCYCLVNGVNNPSRLTFWILFSLYNDELMDMDL